MTCTYTTVTGFLLSLCFRMTPLLTMFFFFFYCYGDHRDLHSFPTRRSSDLYIRDVPDFPTAGILFRDITPLLASPEGLDRKSTRLNSSHPSISYAVFCLKKKKTYTRIHRTRSTTSSSLANWSRR